MVARFPFVRQRPANQRAGATWRLAEEGATRLARTRWCGQACSSRAGTWYYSLPGVSGRWLGAGSSSAAEVPVARAEDKANQCVLT